MNNKKGKGPAKGTPRYTQNVLDLMKETKITKSKLIEEIENGNISYFDILPLLHKIHPDYQKILLDYIPQAKKQFLIDGASSSSDLKKLFDEGKINRQDILVRKSTLKSADEVLDYITKKITDVKISPTKKAPMISMFDKMTIKEKKPSKKSNKNINDLVSKTDIKEKTSVMKKMKKELVKKRKIETTEQEYKSEPKQQKQLQQWQIENKMSGGFKPLYYLTTPKEIKTEPVGVKKLGKYSYSKGKKAIFLENEPELGPVKRKRELSVTSSKASSRKNSVSSKASSRKDSVSSKASSSKSIDFEQEIEDDN